MNQQLWPLLIQFLFGFGFAALILTLGYIIKPKLRKPSNSHPDTFECGVPAINDAKGLFHVKFYMVAVLFIVFDVEAVFLYPWAVTFKVLKSLGLGSFIFFEMITFLVILLLGYFYILKKGGLDWESPE